LLCFGHQRKSVLARMKPLMRLIINQLVRVLSRPEITFVKSRLQPPQKHRLLLCSMSF
jgi:hypothetical protein